MLRSDNTSGCAGVSFNKKRKLKPWFAVIYKGGKAIRLGNFTKLEDAIKARKDAEKAACNE